MKYIKIFITGLLCFLMTISLKAQNTDINIEEIIVTKNTDTCILNSQTKMSDINLFLPRTAGDVFKSMPGLNIVKRSGFSIEPSLHLFKNEQLNLMIDGGTKITQSCANRMDAMTTRISANEIEKIELIKGPYSVRFGQSFGGIINIITKHSKPSDKFKLHGSADLGYVFNGSEFSSGAELGGSNKKIDFLINGTFRDFGNYISGNDTIASSFTAYDYSAKLGYNINKNNRIQASLRQSFANDVLHAGLPMDAVKDKGNLLSVDYQYNNSSNLLSGIKLKAYGSLVDHLMTNEFKKNFVFAYALAPVNSKTMGGKSEFKFSINDKTTLFTGFDSFYKTRDGVRNREVKINACTGVEFAEPKLFTDKIWQNSFTSDFGVFAELYYNFSENTNFKAGLRSDFIQSDILDPEDDFLAFYGENLKPENQNTVDFFAQADFKLPNNFNISIATGKASRTPDLLELFINHSSVGQDAYEYLGNPLLKAEKNMQSDIVFSERGKQYFVYADIFYSYITDFISAKVDTTIPRKFLPCMSPAYTKQFVNVDEVYQYGIDAGFNFAISKNLKIQTNATYTYAHNITWNEPLAEITPFTLNANLSYKYKKFLFALNNRYVAAQNRIAVSFGETESESFDILDLQVVYKPYKFITINFGIDNIADVNYYEHTSRPYKNMDEKLMFFEPGRSFKLSVKVDF